MRYVYTGNEQDAETAKFFWDPWSTTTALPPVGTEERVLRGPDKLDEMVDGRTAETCNVYNMLKMTRVSSPSPGYPLCRFPRTGTV